MHSVPGPAPAPSHHEPQSQQDTQLPFRVKMSYAIGDIPVSIRQSATVNFLLFFYTNVVMLSPSLAGLAFAVGRIWDAVNDPLVGYLSDSTSTRFGRRRPYLLASVIPFGLTFFLLWNPPPGLGTWGNFLFLAVSYILMDTFFTFYATPYLALGAELSREYHERTQIATARALFHGLGAALTLTALSSVVGTSPATVQEGVDSLTVTLPPEALQAGFAQVGALLGGVIVLSGFIAFFGSREVPPPRSRERISFGAFFRNLAGTLKNQPFRIVITSFALLVLGWALHQPLTVYVYRDWLKMNQQLPMVMFLFFLSSMASLGLWARLARRLGKNRAFQICLGWSVLILTLFPLMRADMPHVLFYLFIVFIGLGVGGYALPPAIVADVIDHDELLSGQRREGAFFGLWLLAMKLMAALAVAVVGVALDWIGYVPNQTQSEATLWGLKILYGPVPAVFLFLALLVFLRFPLTRESHADTQRQLQIRQQQATS